MIEFETTVRIGRTPDQVFSVMADFGTYLACRANARCRGQDGRRRWRRQPLHNHGPGRAGNGAIPYEVTGYDPPGRLAGHGVAGPVRFQEEYRLTGTEVPQVQIAELAGSVNC